MHLLTELRAFGAGIFIMGNQSITLGALQGHALLISDQISDQTGSLLMNENPRHGR